MKVVSDQPANFDPRCAAVIGDALRADPDLDLVISPWDDMTRGAEQAIVAAGKKPGATLRSTRPVRRRWACSGQAGAWNETSIFLPFEESYYAAAALMMALDDKPVNAT